MTSHHRMMKLVHQSSDGEVDLALRSVLVVEAWHRQGKELILEFILVRHAIGNDF